MSDFKVVKLLDPITINLGGPNFTGEYVPATTYSIGESVSYLGSSYVALATATGNLPTDVTHWQLLAQKGDAGNAATSYDVRNQTGVAIAKFRAVYFSGSTGLRPLIILSNANTEIASSKTAGVTSVIINNNADGTIVHDGVMSNLDTSSFAVGDFLWLSTTPGVITNVRPTQPNHAVFIGYVTRSHPTLGTALIDIQNGYELEELHDVLITSVTNGQVLSYETSSLMWKNKTLAKADIGLSNVPNVDATNPANIVQDSTHRFVTDTDKTNWDGKVNKAGDTMTGLLEIVTTLATTDPMVFVRNLSPLGIASLLAENDNNNILTIGVTGTTVPGLPTPNDEAFIYSSNAINAVTTLVGGFKWHQDGTQVASIINGVLTANSIDASPVNINGLTQATPIISDFVPFTNGATNYKASLNEMPVSAPQNLNSIVNAIIFG